MDRFIVLLLLLIAIPILVNAQPADDEVIPVDPEVEAIKEDAQFNKIIQPPATTKVVIKQFTVHIDTGIITVIYQTGTTSIGGDGEEIFSISDQREATFHHNNGEYETLFTNMKIDIDALVTALEAKL